MFYGEFAVQLENALLPNEATTLDEFVHELKEALDANQLGTRALDHLFSDQAEFHPTCHGLWMEFGVFEGSPQVISLYHNPDTLTDMVSYLRHLSLCKLRSGRQPCHFDLQDTQSIKQRAGGKSIAALDAQQW